MKNGRLLACAALTLLIACVLFPARADAAPLVINEACGANGKSIKDRDGESPDWIELYNPTDETVDLTGYRLSDDPSEPDTFVFPETSIAPYGYALVFASRKLNMSPELHADFRLSSEGGERVYLFSPDGALIDDMALPSLDRDVAFGRRYDGGEECGRIEPSPGASNNASRSMEAGVFVAPPVFSRESGFYDDDILLTLSASGGAAIYYTLDGSEPTALSTPYTAPLPLSDASAAPNVYSVMNGLTVRSYYKPSAPVDKCHVVRAVAVDGEGRVSDVVTKSYFVGFAGRASCDGVAVVSLVTDPKNLFDHESGIYTVGAVHDAWLAGADYDAALGEYWQPANYQQRGREWEREAEFSYFGVGGDYVFTQTVGVRVHGRITRASSQKSFNVYARDEYGRDTFASPIFPGERETSSLVLRTGGNDAAVSKIRDAFAQRLVADRAVDTQTALPCALFLDGEYWGLYFLEQRYDDDYIEEQYGVDQRNVIIAEYGGIEEGEDAEYALYEEVVNFAKRSDLSLDANYASLAGMIDIDSLIDYFAIEIYLANSDWPWNNYTLWRSRETSDRACEDGLWRYMLNDLDQTMGYDAALSGPARDTFALAAENPIFAALMKNAAFREQFALTFMDLCNTSFAPARTTALLDQTRARLTNATVADYQRVRNASRGVAYYENSIEVIRAFLETRAEAILAYMMDWFSLTDAPVDLTLRASDPAMGSVKINTVTPDLSGGWTGRYFVEYPVALTALPKEGFRFSHWEIAEGSLLGDAAAARVKVRLSAAGTTAIAVFEPIGETDARETLAEFAYHDAAAPLKGNSMQGYAATGGVFGDHARLTASVDGATGRKIEWSDILYEDGGQTPVMRANGKNRWREGAYIDLALSASGYESLRISVRLGADWQGARRLTLSYSTDGEKYTDIQGADTVISRPERMTAAYADFALPDALRNQSELHIRLRVSGDQTVRGRARLPGLTEGEIAFNDLRVTGAKIPVDTSAYQRAATALKSLRGLPQADADVIEATLGGFTTDQKTQREVDEQTDSLYALAEALPFSRAGTEQALFSLPEAARDIAVSLRVPDGIYQLVYPIRADLSAMSTAYLYRFEDGAFTLASRLSPVGKNSARFPLPTLASGLYILLDKPLSVYCTAYTVSPANAGDAFEDGDLAGQLLSAGAWLDVRSLGVGFDGHIEINLSGLGFKGSVWAYRADALDFAASAFSAPVRDGLLVADGVDEGRYLLLSHDAAGISRIIERAEALRARRTETPAASRWPLWAGVGAGACCLLFAAWRVDRYIKRKPKT